MTDESGSTVDSDHSTPEPEIPATSEPLPSDCPFSSSQLAAAMFTLECLAKRPDLAESTALRPFRKSLAPLVDAAIKKRFDGMDPLERKSTKQKRLERLGREQQKKAFDRDLLNKRTLRLERIRQVEAMAALRPGVPLVPDGAVYDGVNLALGQTSGTSSVVSVQNSAAAASRALEDRADEPELNNPRSCYVCKCRFYKLHHFYDQLCPACADLNWTKRMQADSLAGKVALLTGGRVKVGYQICLKLLRAGAFCVVTSRFPADLCERLSKEPDFDAWKQRVKLFGIDLRDLVAVERFADELVRQLPRLDILINNACQTIRRPPQYYRHLLANEDKCLEQGTFAPMLLEGSAHGLASAHLLLGQGRDEPAAPLAAHHLSQVPLLASDSATDAALFPEEAFDVNAQQVDLRAHTTWTTKLAEVQTPEAVEVMAVNSLTPFILNARLKPLLLRAKELDEAAGLPDVGRYIVNVSSMEGKFHRVKDVVHPHLNMAKAALNMMSKTSGPDYARDGIYMTSVDTGWLSNEAPTPTAVKIAKTNFQTPIDEVDGAARVLDPVFSGMVAGDASTRLFGVFLKDYRVTEW